MFQLLTQVCQEKGVPHGQPVQSALDSASKTM